jgi:hypothetical protein
MKSFNAAEKLKRAKAAAAQAGNVPL